MGIEARANQNEVGTHPGGEVLEPRLKRAVKVPPRDAIRQRHILRVPQAASRSGLVRFAGTRIKRMPVNREVADAVAFPKGVLGAVTVMYVPIDDQHAVELMLFDGGSSGDG